MPQAEETNAAQSPLKIVYFGPLGAGKRTTLQQLGRLLNSGEARPSESITEVQQVLELIVKDEQFPRALTLLTLAEDETSELWLPLLRGLNGLVFVADSDPDRYTQDIQAMSALIGRLAALRIKIEFFPSIIQYNKRDLLDAISIPKFEDELNPLGLPAFNTVASESHGILESLKAVAFLANRALKA